MLYEYSSNASYNTSRLLEILLEPKWQIKFRCSFKVYFLGLGFHYPYLHNFVYPEQHDCCVEMLTPCLPHSYWWCSSLEMSPEQCTQCSLPPCCCVLSPPGHARGIQTSNGLCSVFGGGTKSHGEWRTENVKNFIISKMRAYATLKRQYHCFNLCIFVS